MEPVTTKELSQTLGITIGRISQLKTEGRFAGCFTVQRNRILWDEEKAVDAYKNANPSTLISPDLLATSALDIPTFNESKAK